MHIQHSSEVASRLGIELVQTSFGVKNSADKALVRYAESLWPDRAGTIVVGSGDRGFLKWFRSMRERGLRLECVAREHHICKEAQVSYDALYRLDAKRMNLPSSSDLRLAVIDCIPEIQAGAVPVDAAISMLRANRIVPRSTPGRVFFQRHAEVFNVDGSGVGLQRNGALALDTATGGQ